VKHLIVVGGPTAVGKTSVAIALARHFNTVIVSADSRQIYREMNIGVARPSAEELAAVPHHFIASHSIHEPLSAGAYEQEALSTLDQLFQHHDQVIVCGGSGLFIRAITEGFDALPTDHSIKSALQEEYEAKGLTWLQDTVRALDPNFYAKVDQQNHRRLLRAMEVMQIAGQSYSSLRTANAKPRPFHMHFIGLELPREELYQRINERVLTMMAHGLEEEARSLFAQRHLTALQTVGYAELFQYFDNSYSLNSAIERIQQHTRQYAKRQFTWFRNEMNMQWFTPNQTAEMIDYLQLVMDS
jgi:tRNA dimethylallyltransferase